MNLINISNIPSSKAYFDAVFEVVLKVKDKNTAQEEIARIFFQQKGHVRKVINHLSLLGLLETKNTEIKLSKIASRYWEKNIPFDEMIFQGLFTSEAVSDFAKTFLNICLIYGEPIQKKNVDEILATFFLDRSDKSAIASISRNTRSLINLIEWAGLIHKSQQNVQCPASNRVLKRLSFLELMYEGSSLYEISKSNNSKNDISELIDSLKEASDSSYWQKLLSSVVTNDQIYDWSVTSFSKERINVTNKFNQRIRYFVRKSFL